MAIRLSHSLGIRINVELEFKVTFVWEAKSGNWFLGYNALSVNYTLFMLYQ